MLNLGEDLLTKKCFFNKPFISTNKAGENCWFDIPEIPPMHVLERIEIYTSYGKNLGQSSFIDIKSILFFKFNIYILKPCGNHQKFSYLRFLWAFFDFCPYITFVNFLFQATGHSFSPRNVIFGLREPCTKRNWRLLNCLKIIFLRLRGAFFKFFGNFSI